MVDELRPEAGVERLGELRLGHALPLPVDARHALPVVKVVGAPAEGIEGGRGGVRGRECEEWRASSVRGVRGGEGV